MSNHAEIWLQPWCDGCEKRSHGSEGRLWCQDKVWEDCGECGNKSVRYVLDKRQKKSDELLALRASLKRAHAELESSPSRMAVVCAENAALRAERDAAIGKWEMGKMLIDEIGEELDSARALLRYVADISPPDIRARIAKELGE